MKKIMILLLFVLVLLIAPANALALSGHLPFEPNFDFQRIPNPDLLRESANDYIEQNFSLPSNYFDIKNAAGRPFNASSDIIARSMLVYGSPHGDTVGGLHRYLGYTINDDVFTNVHFPHDAWAGGGLETRNWISTPWYDNEVEKYTQNRFGKAIFGNVFNNNPDFEDAIKAGLDYRYHDLPGAITANTFKQDWFQYVHIYQPPTPYTWGMGIMFHKTSGGQMWYMSVPIAPLVVIEKDDLPDFEIVSLEPGTAKTESGTPYTGKVIYKLKDTAQDPVEAKLHLTHNGFGLKTPAGEMIHEKVIIFNPGESKSYQFKWTGQESSSTIRAEIWPTEPAELPKEDRDALPNDNTDEKTVSSKQKILPSNCT